MDKTNSILDHNAIEHFFSDVLRHLLPNARHKSAGFFGSAETVRASQINIDLADSNEINVDSNYFYTKKYSFIHFTSVPTLLNILKEKKIRLYNLSGMDDKEEFEVSLNHSKKKLSDFDITEIKEQIFCFSMCKTELELKEESLPQWRSYAQDGNGIGIIFSFNKTFAKDWVHIILSKVYYNQNSLDKFNEVENLYNEFKTKYNLAISNFDEMFYRYFAFHKNKLYSSEQEIRLIYCQGFHSYDEPPTKYDITKNNKKTSYVELDLEWEWNKETKAYIISQGIKPANIRPIISIDTIVLGYRLNRSAKCDLAAVVHSYLKNFKKTPRIIDSSLYRYFKDR